MKGMERSWAILLAAGEGERVRSLTHDGRGRHVPKQFWSLDGRNSFLRLAIRRAEAMVPRHRIVPVVAAQHRHWWRAELHDLPTDNVIVQPMNKGTAAGVLLPLAHILRRDPSTRVVILPTDHLVRDEDVLARSIVAAAAAVLADPRRIVLLGMVPQESNQDYGWILPADGTDELQPRRVKSFVEKPDEATARLLARQGGLLNSLILVAFGGSLLRLFQLTIPSLAGRLLYGASQSPMHPKTLEKLYRTAPKCDFSRDVLEASSAWLSVIPVPDCGWTDIGTPTRLRPFLGGPPAPDQGTSDSVRV